MSTTEFSMYAGDTKNLEITVKDEDGVVVDITGATFHWALALLIGVAPPVLTKTNGSGVTIVNAAAGRVDVKLESVDTESLSGKYAQELRLVDVDDNVATILQGVITILPTQTDVTP